jgi:hypothetical protein
MIKRTQKLGSSGNASDLYEVVLEQGGFTLSFQFSPANHHSTTAQYSQLSSPPGGGGGGPLGAYL